MLGIGAPFSSPLFIGPWSLDYQLSLSLKQYLGRYRFGSEKLLPQVGSVVSCHWNWKTRDKCSNINGNNVEKQRHP